MGLEPAGSEMCIRDSYWGVDLSSEHERYLAEEHFKAPVVVKNYPKDIIKDRYRREKDFDHEWGWRS